MTEKHFVTEETKWKAGIITASDKGFAGQRQDESGAVIRSILEEAGYQVEEQVILPDDLDSLAQEMIRMADTLGLQLVLTTGGTGFSLRDVTPEATRAVIERECSGIAEAMRYHSLAITPKAMLSRGVSGIRGRTLIINLPGSPKAVRESLEYIIKPLEHGIEILMGEAAECAR